MRTEDLRDVVKLLREQPLAPNDKHQLDRVVENVAMYRTIGAVDIETITHLRTKYLEPKDATG